jgi:hypothetical protein
MRELMKSLARTLFCQLARIGNDDLSPPSIISDLPRHTDAFAAERCFRRPELRPIVSKDHRSEDRIGIGLIEIEERRLRAGAGCELRARPEIVESTFDRVKYGFTTSFQYHMLWW